MEGFGHSSSEETDENINDEEEYSNEPPAKKMRGAASKYCYVETVDEFADVKQKVKEAELKLHSYRDINTFYICKEKPCALKWKVLMTAEGQYEIHSTEGGHTHEVVERKNGLTREMKNVVDERISRKQAVNAGAVLQAFRSKGWRNDLPTSLQIKNYVAFKRKKTTLSNSDDIFDADIQQMEIKNNMTTLKHCLALQKRTAKKWLAKSLEIIEGQIYPSFGEAATEAKVINELYQKLQASRIKVRQIHDSMQAGISLMPDETAHTIELESNAILLAQMEEQEKKLKRIIETVFGKIRGNELKRNEQTSEFGECSGSYSESTPKMEADESSNIFNLFFNPHSASEFASSSESPPPITNSGAFELFSNTVYADFTLISSDNVEFPTYRLLLSHFSETFADIFKTHQNSFKIPEFDSSIIRTALECCYGKCHSVLGKEREVYNFAVAYKMENLKKACIESPVLMSNIFEMIQLAFTHNLEELKESCKKFILVNKSTMDQSLLFTTLSPEILAFVFCN